MNVTIQGTKVPALGFGTWELKGEACQRAVERALSVGYRHIDTAEMYANERDVGKALLKTRVKREDIFLVSKVWKTNFAYSETLRSVNASLDKMRVDYIDLMLMHWPAEDDTPHSETLGALVELQKEGVIRHIGVSNFSPTQVRDAAKHATVFCNQIPYHPYKSQAKLLEQAQKMDYLVTAYRPLERGKVLDDPVLQEIGAAHHKNPAQVALRWLIQQPQVCAIPRSSSEKHITSNFEIFDFELSDEEMKRISSISK